jgi:hypothetical protein
MVVHNNGHVLWVPLPNLLEEDFEDFPPKKNSWYCYSSLSPFAIKGICAQKEFSLCAQKES